MTVDQTKMYNVLSDQIFTGCSDGHPSDATELSTLDKKMLCSSEVGHL